MIAAVTALSKSLYDYLVDNGLEKKDYILVRTERDVLGRNFDGYILLHGHDRIGDMEFSNIIDTLQAHQVKRIYNDSK